MSSHLILSSLSHIMLSYHILYYIIDYYIILYYIIDYYLSYLFLSSLILSYLITPTLTGHRERNGRACPGPYRVLGQAGIRPCVIPVHAPDDQARAVHRASGQFRQPLVSGPRVFSVHSAEPSSCPENICGWRGRRYCTGEDVLDSSLRHGQGGLTSGHRRDIWGRGEEGYVISSV